MSLSVTKAKQQLREALEHRYTGDVKGCVIGICTTFELAPSSDIHVRSDGFEVTAPNKISYVGHHNAPENEGHLVVHFKDKQDYMGAYDVPHTKIPQHIYNVGYMPQPERSPAAFAILEWGDEAWAQKFAEAFNRLLYAAYHGPDPAELVEFSKAARQWRQSGGAVQLSDAADRERVLAENAIEEKRPEDAVDHFESGLELQPMWPQGWYDAALIYGELKDYESAADRMRHYLELAPDAPDAKAAREQMIIWEDKAKH